MFIGNNGSGKTNLLEAMAYCGLGKSIRFHSDQEMLRFSSDRFHISADFMLETGLSLEVSFSFQDGIKQLSLDGQPVRQLSRVLEAVKIIYCAPEDINIITGSPRFRRQYFDLSISQVYPKYLPALRNYLHVIKQRNSLLKSGSNHAQKSSWDKRFAGAYLELIEYRLSYLRDLNAQLDYQYLDISETVKALKVLYEPVLQRVPPEEINEAQVLDWLKQNENREKHYERTLIGAHLDDYRFLLNDHDLKLYGSGGQKRIVVVIMKLIQANLIHDKTSIRPIFLFDDIFAELDTIHMQRIQELIDDKNQVFITSPRQDLALHWPKLPGINLPLSPDETK